MTTVIVGKQKNKIIKRIKKYDKYDKELKTYTESVLADPLVYSFSFLRDELDRVVGFAGYTDDNKIRYIWIFRKCRGGNLGAKFCEKYGVIQPTPELMQKILDLNGFESNGWIESDNEIWNVDYGFVVRPGLNCCSINYDQYNYGVGTFNSLSLFLPFSIEVLDLYKIEKIFAEKIENSEFKRSEIDIKDFLQDSFLELLPL
jgi:hypothetical protein